MPQPPAISASLARVPPSGIRELGNLALGMEGVLPLYFGESNLPTPAFIVDAAAQAMRDGFTRYSQNAGCRCCARSWPVTTTGFTG